MALKARRNILLDHRINRAKTYPYTIPGSSYIFREGHSLKFLGPLNLADLKGRRPVLAVGSNQSPNQLARKFAARDWGPIPVIRAKVKGYDSVYSPHITSYGSIPATLQEVSGVTASLFVTWLNNDQMMRMHETEIAGSNYTFGILVDLDAEMEVGPPIKETYVYISNHGHLCDGGHPIPLSEINALKRMQTGRSQLEIQQFVRDFLEPRMEINEFIGTSIHFREIRRRRSIRLKALAQSIQLKSFDQIPI